MVISLSAGGGGVTSGSAGVSGDFHLLALDGTRPLPCKTCTLLTQLAPDPLCWKKSKQFGRDVRECN